MRLYGAILLCALSGCALLEPVPRPAVAVDSLVGDAVSLSLGAPAEQRAGLIRAQEQFAREPTATNRLRLATLLATLPPPLRDDARALELLESLGEADSPGHGRLATFLALQLAERQRLARELERLGKERAAERAALAAAERERLAAEKERDKREEALRQQLEALRAIERGILEREERARQRSGARP